VKNDELAQLYKSLTKTFFQDEEGFDKLFHDWACHMFRNPDQRNLTSWVITSDAEGIGKSLIGELLVKAMGWEEPNSPAKILGPEDLFNQYNDWAGGCVYAVVNEPSSDNEKHTKAMKALRSNDSLSVNRKYGAKFTIKNYLNLWITTNEGFSHGMSRDSRRDIVYNPKSVARDPEWRGQCFRIANRLTKPEALAAIMHYYLNEHDLGAYSYKAAAPDSGAKGESSEEAEAQPMQVARKIHEAFGREAVIPLSCIKEIARFEGIFSYRKLLATVRRISFEASAPGADGASDRVTVDGKRVRVIVYSDHPNKDAAKHFVKRRPDAENQARRALEIATAWVMD
jgi:hypothetical protein